MPDSERLDPEKLHLDPKEAASMYADVLRKLSNDGRYAVLAYNASNLSDLINIDRDRLLKVHGVTTESANEVLEVRDALRSQLTSDSGAAPHVQDVSAPIHEGCSDHPCEESVIREQACNNQASGNSGHTSGTDGKPSDTPTKRHRMVSLRASHATPRESCGPVRQCAALPERNADEPEPWSILRRSLGRLRRRSEPGDSVRVADLGLGDEDIACLRSIAILPDDSLDDLLSLALGVIADSGISAAAFRAIQARCPGWAALEIRDLPIVSEADVRGMENWDPRAIGVQLCAASDLRAMGIRKLGDSTRLSERDIIMEQGFGLHTLRDIGLMWRLRGYVSHARATMPLDLHSSYDHYIDHIMRVADLSGQTAKIYEWRRGLRDGERRTLEDIGNELGVTRERVRQIEKAADSRFALSAKHKKLDATFHLMRSIVEDGGGACAADEMAAKLAKWLAWPLIPQAACVEALASLSPSLHISRKPPSIVTQPSYPCLSCTDAAAAIADAVDAFGGAPDADECIGIAQASTANVCAGCAAGKTVFSRGYVLLKASIHTGLRVEGNMICTPLEWARRFGRPTEAVEAVLRSAGRAMHFTEVAAVIRKVGREAPDNNVHAILDRCSKALLWDRGAFIHRDLVVMPHELMRLVEDDIIRRLIGGVPLISVSGVFRAHEASLKEHGIPTDRALYSCLRLSPSEELAYTDYPFVVLRRSGPDRPSLFAVLEEFVRSRPDGATVAEIRGYLIDTICINSALVGNYISKIPNTVKTSEDVFGHIDHVGIGPAEPQPVGDCVDSAGAFDWDHEKQAALEGAALSHYGARRARGMLYGLVDGVMQCDYLPALPQGIPWTPALMARLLKSSDRFLVAGSGVGVFVPVPNIDAIANADELAQLIDTAPEAGVSCEERSEFGLPEVDEESHKLSDQPTHIGESDNELTSTYACTVTAVGPPTDWLAGDLESLRPIAIDASRCTTLADFEACLQRVVCDARFLGRIEMLDDQLNVLIDAVAVELESASSPRLCAIRLADDYPCAVSYALSHIAAAEYDRGTVWPMVARRLRMESYSALYSLAESIEICQQRYSLATSDISERQRYVSAILFQTGIPDSCISEFIELVQRDYTQRGIVTPRNVIGHFREELQARRWRELQYQLSEPVLDFLEYGQDWAEQWIVVAAAFLGSRSDLSPELRQLAPSRLMRTLEAWAKPEVAVALEQEEPKTQRPRHARPHTRLDFGRRAICVRVGERYLEGKFGSSGDHLRAILTDSQGNAVRAFTLDASLTTEGVIARSLEFPLPTIEGPIKLDIEYAGTVLESYPVEALAADSPCMAFSHSGEFIGRDLLDYGGAWMVVRKGTRVLPEQAVKSRDRLADHEQYELVWLSTDECGRDGLVVEYRDLKRTFEVNPGRVREGVALGGGDRVEGLFINGQPVYSDRLPVVAVRGARSSRDDVDDQYGVRVVVDSLIQGKRVGEISPDDCGYLTEKDGSVSLDTVVELMDVPSDDPVMVTIEWIDPLGEPRSISVTRMPGFAVFFEDWVIVPCKTPRVQAEVVVPDGWELDPGAGTRVTSSDSDGSLLEVDTGHHAPHAFLRLGETSLRADIEIPKVQWRFDWSSGIADSRWRSEPADIWLEDILSSERQTLAVMTTAERPPKVTLEAEPTAYRSMPRALGSRVVEFDIGELADIVRSNPPAVKLQLVLVDQGTTRNLRVPVATIRGDWVPDQPNARLSGNQPHERIELTWMGAGPRRQTAANLRPAWTPRGQSYESTIPANGRSCVFPAAGAIPGPYSLSLVNSDEQLWGGGLDAYPKTPVWVSRGETQVREFQARRQRWSFFCSGHVYPHDKCAGFEGIVMRNRNGISIDRVPLKHCDGGRFELEVDAPRDEISAIGVWAPGDSGPYRFVAVGRCPEAFQTLSIHSVPRWVNLFDDDPGRLRMWIARYDVDHILVPPASAKKILEQLVGGSREVEFSLDSDRFPGTVTLIAIPGSDSEFEFDFPNGMVICLEERCPGRGKAISKTTWDADHYNRRNCKRFTVHRERVRAQVLIEIGLGSILDQVKQGGTSIDAYARVIADSCFRPLGAINGVDMHNPTGLAELLVRAYARRCRALMDEWGFREEKSHEHTSDQD